MKGESAAQRKRGLARTIKPSLINGNEQPTASNKVMGTGVFLLFRFFPCSVNIYSSRSLFVYFFFSPPFERRGGGGSKRGRFYFYEPHRGIVKAAKRPARRGNRTALCPSSWWQRGMKSACGRGEQQQQQPADHKTQTSFPFSHARLSIRHARRQGRSLFPRAAAAPPRGPCARKG